MIPAMIKSALILAVAACIATVLRQKSAALRHTVWTAGLFGALIIPLCTIALPSWQTEIAGPATTFIEAALESRAALAIRNTAIVVWIAGAALGILALLFGAGRLAWVAVRSEPIEDQRWAGIAEEVRRNLGIRRPVRLLQNRSVPFLGTWGIMVPRVLVPADAEKWSDDRIRMVLGHELAHIKRHDWVVQVLAEAARAIYWFNPIFWIAYSRLRRESEHACDDAVVRMGASGTEYAEELLNLTRALRSERRVQSPILAMAQPSHLERRLVALVNPSLNRLAATPWAVLVVAFVAVALTLPLAAVRAPERNFTKTDPSVALASQPAPPTAPTTAVAVEQVVEKPKVEPKVKSNQVSTRVAEVVPQTLPQSAPESLAQAAPPAMLPPTAPVDLDVNALTAKKSFSACNVTSSVVQVRMEKMKTAALGDGPWIINADRTIWVWDQPYTAGREVNTMWVRPADVELLVKGTRLDGEATPVEIRAPATFEGGYLGTRLKFPTAGCWEVTATAGDSKLTFVTKVEAR